MERRSVVINASSRPHGLTDRVGRIVEEHLSEAGYRGSSRR